VGSVERLIGFGVSRNGPAYELGIAACAAIRLRLRNAAPVR
jgi:hypothetical protein